MGMLMSQVSLVRYLLISLFMLSSTVYPFDKGLGAARCYEIFQEAPTLRFQSKSSAESQRFWIEISKELQAVLNDDFGRAANQFIYSAEARRGHPQPEFLQNLGFIVQPDGLKAPPVHHVLANLMERMALLNKKLETMSGDVQIRPEMHLSLRHRVTKSRQQVVLSPLHNFSAPGFSLRSVSNVLDHFEFINAAAEGRFPIGGIENAAPPQVSREIINLPAHIAKPNLSEFLHDLGHLGVFDRHPEFAVGYVRAYRDHLSRLKKLNERDQNDYLLNAFGKRGSQLWWTMFLFSEGSWITRPGYQEILNHWPDTAELLRSADFSSSGSLQLALSKIDGLAREKLWYELKDIKDNWWRLFDPLGGATNDMISARSFAIRSQFPVYKALIDLEKHVDGNPQDTPLDSLPIEVALRMLKYSEKLSISRWEYFARSRDVEKTQTFKALQQMFPQDMRAGSDNDGWAQLRTYLYETNR